MQLAALKYLFYILYYMTMKVIGSYAVLDSQSTSL